MLALRLSRRAAEEHDYGSDDLPEHHSCRSRLQDRSLFFIIPSINPIFCGILSDTISK